MHKKLHIFTVHGRTFTFLNATIVASNETVLAFTYGAVSDGLPKTATFWLATMAGYSCTSD